MLGLIGAVVFGAVFAGSWMIAEGDEQKSREDSKRSGKSLYIDKNGKFRHTDTGKRYTTEDAIRNIKKFNKEYEDRRNQFKPKYWGFERFEVAEIRGKDGNIKKVLDNCNFTGIAPTIELFDSHEECVRAFDIQRETYEKLGVDGYNLVIEFRLNKYSEIDIKCLINVDKKNVHYNF